MCHLLQLHRLPGGTVKNTEGLTQQNITSWTSKGMYDLYATWNYGTDKNAWGGGVSEKLGEYIDEKLTNWKDNYSETASSSDMATYLLQKIGYVDAKTDKVHGMCASVMKQCQDFTFENASKSNKKYIFDNEVVRQYLMATLTKIKLSQDSILADYAEDCRSDVTSCLSTNGYDESNTSTTASQTAVNACRADIQTCMSVTGQKPSDAMKLTLRAMADWVKTMLLVCPEYKYMNDTGEGEVSCERCATVDKYVENSNGTITKQGTIQLYAPSGSVGADSCVCPDNTTVYDDGCLER